MKMMSGALLVVVVLFFSHPCCAEGPRCSEDALKQARKLLLFHFEQEDDRIEIDKAVKELAPIQNPANREQKFQVLEVWGRIYKGRYRMRFIYFHSGKSCVLVGQEILEYVKL